jgi:WD40 repeat protein
MSYEYQVGGSLKLNSTCYVTRPADEELFQSLLDGEICYVFNARQMGKSSLQLRVGQRLADLNIRCATIDMTRIGGEQVTLEQWYRGVILNLLSSLNLIGTVQLKQRWQEWQDLPMLQRLSLLIEEILTIHLPDERLVIFIDEVDSALSLDFSVDDFFAFVRFCYNYRATDPNYDRLTWALFGVTTPANLIQDKTRTPFNIGRQIYLQGFQMQESCPLSEGLTGFVSHPLGAVQAILAWTNGQPLLTQKLCRLLIATNNDHKYRSTDERIDDLVNTHIITNWQTQDQPEHLRTIRDRLLRNEQSASRLLSIYQIILREGGIKADNSVEQAELLLSGLVDLHDNSLQVHNRIYAIVFDQAWVDRELANLRPYSLALNDWLISDRTDESKLLRGKSLSQAQAWIQGKRLSDDDYQFIAASQAYDLAEVQKNLEAERLQAVEAQLQQEQRSNRLQRILLVVGMITIVITSGFGGVAYWNYHRAIASELQARVSEIKILLASANSQLSSNHALTALLESMQAKRRGQQLQQLDAIAEANVQDSLRQSFLAIHEVNQLPHESTVYSVRFSPDGELIASGGIDGRLKIWRSNGELVANIAAHQGAIRVLRFSPDGQMIATGGEDSCFKLWQRDGSLIRTVNDFKGGIWRLEFSDYKPQIGTISMDRFAKIWTIDGQLVQSFEGKDDSQIEGTTAISPDINMLAVGARNHHIQLWRRRNGLPFSRLKGHQSTIWGMAFSPNHQLLASGSDDGVVKLWNNQGKLLHTLGRLQGAATVLVFSSDNQFVAAAGSDQRIWVWHVDGRLVATLENSGNAVWDLAFSPDGQMLASADADKQVHLWRLRHPLTQSLLGHQGVIVEIDLSPDATTILTIGEDGVMKLWNRQGQLLTTSTDSQRTLLGGVFNPSGNRIVTTTLAGYLEFRDRQGNLMHRVKGNSGGIHKATFSPDGELLVTGGQGAMLSLWTGNGELIKQITAHESSIQHIAFSPDGQAFVSSSIDHTAKLWDRQGNFLAVLRGHTGPIMQAVFSPDGEYIITASSDQTLRFWQSDGTLVKTIPAHEAAIWAVAISPDGEYIASGGFDNLIKIWTKDGTLLATLTGNSGAIYDLKFTPDGKTLISGGTDKQVRLWQVDRILQDDLFRSSCEWLVDYLNSHHDQYLELQQECHTVQSDVAAMPNKIDNTRSSSEGTR